MQDFGGPRRGRSRADDNTTLKRRQKFRRLALRFYNALFLPVPRRRCRHPQKYRSLCELQEMSSYCIS